MDFGEDTGPVITRRCDVLCIGFFSNSEIYCEKAEYLIGYYLLFPERE